MEWYWRKWNFKKRKLEWHWKQECTLSLPRQQGSQQTPYYHNTLTQSTKLWLSKFLHGEIWSSMGPSCEGSGRVPTPESVPDHVWMWYLGTWFSGEQGSGAGMMVGFNDLESPFWPWQFCDSVFGWGIIQTGCPIKLLGTSRKRLLLLCLYSFEQPAWIIFSL